MSPSLMDKAVARANIADIGRTLTALSVPWWLAGGTCLGAIRDGDFIDHDPDTDLGVWEDAPPEAIIRELEKLGFVVTGAAGTLPCGYEIAVTRGGVRTDIFWHYRCGGSVWNAVWVYGVMHKFVYARWLALAPCDALGFPAWVPDPVEPYLTTNYGQWRTVVTDWSCIRDSGALERD